MSVSKALGLGSAIAVMCVSQIASAAATSQSGMVKAGYWDNVSGGSVDQLIVLDSYPDNPDQVAELTELRSPQNRGSNYGSLVRGYIIAPTDGLYTFFVAGDNETQFWLSTSENPESAEVVADVTGASSPDDYTKYGSQTSGAVELSAGQRYYFEIRHKERSGGDHFNVAWEGPGIPQQIIGGSSIASLGQAKSTTPIDQEEGDQTYSKGYRAGFLDGTEDLNFNPQHPFLDEDQDGIYDNWEVIHGLDPSNPDDALSDPDNDLLKAADEFLMGTRENNPDSDEDGIPDGVEFAYGLDPLEPSDAQQDMDGDGFSNLEEHQANTDPSDSADAPVTADSEPVTSDSEPVAAASQVSGFIGQYFEGTDFDRFVLSRQDKTIDFAWGRDQPMTELPEDNFSIRWTGMFTAPHSSGTEEYEFTSLTDDGVRLYLDDNLVINEWKDHGATPYSHTVALGAQETIPVTMEYYEGCCGTRAQLSITRLASGEDVSTSENVTAPDPAEPSGQDTDGDGIPDTWELAYGLNAWADDANSVYNLEGVSNLEAYQSELDPWNLEPVTVEPVTTDPVTTEPEPQPAPEPEPTLNEVSLSWTAPLKRTDGSSISLAQIDQFEIRYGQDQGNQDQSVTAAGDATSVEIGDLEADTWYFSMRVIDSGGRQSVLSEPVEHIVE